MQNTRYQTVFFTTALLLTLLLSILIFWPYLISLSISAMLAIILYPLHRRIVMAFKSETISAAFTIFLVVLLIGVPLIFLGNQILLESQELYTKVSSGNVVSLDYVTQKAQLLVQRYVPDFNFNAREYLAGFSAWVVEKIGGVFSGTLDFGIKSLLSLIALFYFLRDGEYFKKKIIELSPLGNDKDKVLISTLKSAINSVLLGSLVVALIQGFLTGVGFAFFGVPNFALWGSLAAIAALVPGVGTSLVWVPAVIYLYFYGSTGIWIAELIWSLLLVGLIDNFLSPFIINKGVKVHPLLILFSILGGIQFFGPEGVLLGPLVLSILFALLRLASAQGDTGKSI